MTLKFADRMRSFARGRPTKLVVTAAAVMVIAGPAFAADRSIAGVDMGMSRDEVKSKLSGRKYQLLDFPDKDGIGFETGTMSDFHDNVAVMFVNGKAALLERSVQLGGAAEVPHDSIRQGMIEKWGTPSEDNKSR